MWCIGELTKEYVERMEDVLNLYERPLDTVEPVVCLDEKPVQLLKDARPSIPCQPGRIEKQDSEYVRMGTCNVFCGVEPKAGKHFTKVTENRKYPEFAKMIQDISEEYTHARTIHLVMDNLSSHSANSLIKHFGETKGREIWDRFTVHYTPKHASWLDQAEIEIGLFSRLCIGKQRIGSIESLRAKAEAWNKSINEKKTTINWKFTTKKARKKFGYKKLKIKRSEY